MLVNLVGNARKFTEYDEITVELTLESETAVSSVLRFTVSDTGPGIPFEAQDKIFSPFCQADDSSTCPHGGTGLGLAISAQIVEFMGGKIELESTPGAGAALRFMAHLERGPEKPKTEAELRASPRDTRALVVEAQGLGARFLRRQLESWGLICERAIPGDTRDRALERQRRRRIRTSHDRRLPAGP